MTEDGGRVAVVTGAAGGIGTAVCPGLVDTSMADWIRQDEEALTQWTTTVPARRIGTAEEVAATIAFLASAAGSYVHGAVLMADGGSTA